MSDLDRIVGIVVVLISVAMLYWALREPKPKKPRRLKRRP